MKDNTYISDENDLLKVRDTRFAIIDSLLNEGKPPEDLDKLKLLLTTLSDTDRVSLTKMRIRSEDKANEATAGSAAVIASFLNRLGSFPQPEAIENVTPPSLSDNIEVTDLVPGEMQIGCSNTNYEEFSKKHFKQPE